MAVNFITPAEITSLSAAAWTTVSAPAAVPTGATGVFGFVLNNNATVTTSRQFGMRHPSDTTRNNPLDERGAGKAAFFIVGLDGSKQFDYYIENATDNQIYVTGYFDSEATFLTAATDFSFTKDGTLQSDVDFTAATAADATAVILEINNVTNGRAWLARHADDAVATYNDRAQLKSYVIVPLKAGQLADLRAEDASSTWYVLGYLTGGVVDTAYVDVTPASDTTWTAVTNPGADATAALVCLIDDSNSTHSGATWGARKKGATAYTWYPGETSNGCIAMVELDASQDLEVYASDVTTNDTSIQLMATFSAAAAAARPMTIGIGNLNSWIK